MVVAVVVVVAAEIAAAAAIASAAAIRIALTQQDPTAKFCYMQMQNAENTPDPSPRP